MAAIERPMGEYKFQVLGLVAKGPRGTYDIITAISDAKRSKRILVDPPTRQAVKRLEAAGLIQRSPDGASGTILFSATETGTSELERQRRLRFKP